MSDLTSTKKAKRKYDVKPLFKGFDAKSFDCGSASMNDWLMEFAWPNHAADSAKTVVCVHQGHVIAYYSLAAGSVAHEEATPRIGKGQPRRGKIPVVVLARLAVDKNHKGKGLGSYMLAHALQRCMEVSRTIGARAIIAHAKDQNAKKFYERYDFESSPINDTTMMLSMKDLREAYAGAFEMPDFEWRGCNDNGKE